MKPQIDEKPIVTMRMIVDLLTTIGIKSGDTLIVHSSLKSLGYVVGGPEALINAILSVVGKDGTVIMPTQSVEFSDPSTWEYPPVDSKYWDFIRKSSLPYDPITTPVTKGIGIVPETFRKYPNVVRTKHPMYSFAIWGKRTNDIYEQEYDFGLGVHSPLGHLYSKNISTKILMIGTDFDTNTSLHLAEHYLNRKPFEQSSYVSENHQKVLKRYQDIPMDIYDDFKDIQRLYDQTHEVGKVSIFKGNVTQYNFKSVVDFAIKYYQSKEELKSKDD